MGADWGSVADWVGAVGGVGGAGTAAMFYFLDRKRARLSQEAEEKKRTKFDTDVATHLYILMRGIIDVSRSYLEQEITFANTIALRAELAAFATTATRMQSLSGLSIDRFMDLCDLLEAVTDRRIEGKDLEAIREAVAHVRYVADPMQESLAQELRLDS